MAENGFLECPEPGGKYAVGQCDCLWQSASGHKIVVRIFYPVDKDEAVGCERAAWLPQTYGTEGITYAQAYARAILKVGVNSTLLGSLGFAPMMTRVRTRTLAGAPLSSACESLTPLVFSHGLVGTRSCYSTICVEIASHGFLVVAPEHSDGSAALNVLPDGTRIDFKHAPRKAFWAGSKKRIPKGFTSSLRPENQEEPMSQYTFRKKQLSQRVDEVTLVADCLEALNGDGAHEGVQLPEELGGGCSRAGLAWTG